jgi:hypothetical protein
LSAELGLEIETDFIGLGWRNFMAASRQISFIHDQEKWGAAGARGNINLIVVLQLIHGILCFPLLFGFANQLILKTNRL